MQEAIPIDQGIVSQAFKYSGTRIITPTKTYDPNNEFDEEYFEFGLFMSRREYQTIRPPPMQEPTSSSSWRSSTLPIWCQSWMKRAENDNSPASPNCYGDTGHIYS